MHSMTQSDSFKLIAYRGNFEGHKPYFINKPEYVDIALQYGYDAMVDVWIRDGEFWLGHDTPRYEVSESFLELNGMWCRAMNIETFDKLLQNQNIHSFIVMKDDPQTLTSRNVIWSTNPIEMITNTVFFDPDLSDPYEDIPFYGVCSNFVKELKEKLTGKKQKELDMNDARTVINIVPNLENFDI